ncbi:YSIRK-type signal peptide-containing protein [Streptococcus suis]|nr:YSIRK-type signal peptide-containing protein [Streptococcus suis]HEM5553459.1 G5 domain-containing protein [Streptococcus suis]
MHKFFYEQRKAFSFRKLTIGLVSLCVGTSLLFGIQSQEVSASTVSPSQIRFEYVLEAELSAEERQLIQSSLPAELKEEATYFVVYRPSKKVLPATGELAGSGLAVLGLGFLVLAVSATKSKKARVLTMLYVTTSGLALPVLEVGAVQSSALAAYNQTYVLKPGEALPDGRLTIAGYDFVGYFIEEKSEVKSQARDEKTSLSTSNQLEESKTSPETAEVDKQISTGEVSGKPDQASQPIVEQADKTEQTGKAEESQDQAAQPTEAAVEEKLITTIPTEAPSHLLPTIDFQVQDKVEEIALEIPEEQIETNQLPLGQSRVEEGQAGSLRISYQEVLVDGQVIARKEISREEIPSTPRKVYIGTGQVVEGEVTETDSPEEPVQPTEAAVEEKLITTIPTEAPIHHLPTIDFQVQDKVEEIALEIPEEQIETDELAIGQSRVEEGQAGSLRISYQEVLVAGQIVARNEISREEIPSTPKRTYIGTRRDEKYVAPATIELPTATIRTQEEEITFERKEVLRADWPLGKVEVVAGKKGKQLHTYAVIEGVETLLKTEVLEQAEAEITYKGVNRPETTTEEIVIDFTERVISDPEQYTDYRQIEVTGEQGLKRLHKENGQLVNEEIVKPAKEQVVRVGTKPIEGQVEKESLRTIDFARRYESNDQLEYGQTRTKQPGQSGQEKVISAYQTIKGVEGQLLSSRTVSVSPVQDEIIEVGTKPQIRIEQEEPVTEYVPAPDKERNVQTVLQEGHAKETIYRTVYNLDTNSGQVMPIQLPGTVSHPGQVRRISVGTKPTITKKALPFTEETIPNSTLYVGERVIVRPGRAGEEITTVHYTLNPRTGETSASQPQIQEIAAVTQVVQVGTKAVDRTVETVDSRDIAFKTEYRADSTLPYPQREELQVGSNGVERITTTRRYVRDQEVGEPSRVSEVVKAVQNRIIKVGTQPVERTEQVILQEIRRQNAELAKGTENVIHVGSPTIRVYRTNYSVDPTTGQITTHPEVLVSETEGRAREVEIGTKEPEQPVTPPTENEESCPIIPDNTDGGTCEAPTVPTEKPSSTDSGTTIVPEPEQPNISETEPVSPKKPEETTEETVEDVNKPLLRVVKNEPHYHLMKHVRSSKVTYELKDTKKSFKKAVAKLYVNDKEIESTELNKESLNQGKFQVRFRNLLPNVDYFVRTDLVYTDSKNVERTEHIHDEVHVDFEERHFEIKNIDEVEVWKNEDGRLVRKVAIKVDPNDVQNYFIKLKSDEHKDVLLPVAKIEKTSLDNVTHFKLQARFTNPEEKTLKTSSYHDIVTVYLPRESRENYSTFSKLLEAMRNQPYGTFELKQDLTASEVDLSASATSYLSGQFGGTLKGNGFTIHDLKVPLFNDLRGNVSDLNLKAVDIQLPKETKVGALAKQSDNATITNVHAQGHVFAENKIGGLIGEAYQTNMTNISFNGEIAGLKNVDNNMIGGIAGWLGGGKIEKGYVDATISAVSSNVKAGGLVGQMENANTQILSSFATGSIATTKTKDTEVGGLVGAILKGNSQDNSIQLRDNIAAVHVVNGHKVYGRVEENLQPFSDIRIVTGKAVGENNPSASITEIDAAGAEEELKAWSILPSEKEAARKLRQKNAFDIDYATAQFALAERKQAYENMEKLLPFFTRDVIIQYGNRLEKDDELVTKKLLDVVPLVDKVPFLDILGTSTGKNNQDLPNRDKINGLLLHFDDGTVKYQYLVKKKDMSRGAVTEYLILDKNISYTPDVMANDFEYKKLLGSLISEFEGITFDSSAVQDALGLNGNPYSRDKEWLFLKESFENVKSNLQAHLSELISNYNLVGLDSSIANHFLKSHISKNKAQLLLGLAYMNRWYNIQFGDFKAKNLMMKKADFFGQNVNSLDQLIRIGSMGAEMLKPKNNYALASQVIAKESIGGDLFDYLEGYRKAFAPKMTNNDWFKSSTKATIIETPSTIKEVLEKQTNPTKDVHHNGFYEKLAGENWKFKEMALILLAMPSKDIFILTDMANTLIGMYDNNSNVSEERFQEIAKMWAGHADYLYNILPEEHKEKMFRRTITWDTKDINNDWKALDKLTSMNYSGMKHFYLPLGYVYPNESKGAHADTRMDGIYFFRHDAIMDDGARVYTHEMTHIGDDNTLLLGYGKRTGLDFEVYARGLFESITWDNQDRFGINNIYDFSKYDERNYGRRLTNKTPERFKSTQDLQDYMKGYLDVIYTLDILEAEAVLGLSNSQAKQNWFNQMVTQNGNTSVANQFTNSFTSLDQLIDNGMISRRPYGYGYNSDANAYLEVRAFDPIYGSLNNDGTSRNEYEVRKIAFELLAEYGYKNGMVPYLSDQHKKTLGQSEAYGRMKDSDLISLISKETYKNSAEFRKAMFAKRQQRLENLKPVELITKNLLNGDGYFYETTRTVNSATELRQLMQAAVEYDATHQKYYSQNGQNVGTQSRVYSLKAAVLNGYLRATNDFRESIYVTNP